MVTIATLGPEGTFSDLATSQFVNTSASKCSVRYYPSISQVLKAVGQECVAGVLPIENFSEGFIPVVLDTLAFRQLYIIHEIALPVEFTFVSKSRHLDEIKTVFVQFAAKGQCSEFLSSLKAVQEITTQSNIESLAQLSTAPLTAGAVVPSHAVNRNDFCIALTNIHDFENNTTRFVAISSERPTGEAPRAGTTYKTSIVVYGENDYPGLLYDALASFATRKINITSLVSRPNRATFGRYNFFVDIEGHAEDLPIKTAIGEIEARCELRLLGSYQAA